MAQPEAASVFSFVFVDKRLAVVKKAIHADPLDCFRFSRVDIPFGQVVVEQTVFVYGFSVNHPRGIVRVKERVFVPVDAFLIA